ncbi:MAG TPA: DinB family protein [Dehalococcoidia bacterium]|nr:DinB family protein [Dehalococcoidia bacterium]
MPEITDELRDRILSYIAHNAAKPRANIRELIESQHRTLLAALDGVTDERASVRPPGDEWCIKDVLRHVVDGKRMTARLVEGLARGERIEGRLPLGARDHDSDSDLASLVAAAEEAHRTLLETIDRLPEEVDRTATFEHPFFGPLDALGWAVFQRVHDADHSQQIRAMLAQV